jgi:rhodanese-related sulfurtransferase
LHIPLSELRSRAAELPKDRQIVVYCQKGQRGYLGTCALQGLGFEKVSNLRGGFLQARLNGLPLEGLPPTKGFWAAKRAEKEGP